MTPSAPGGATLRIAAIGDLHLSGHPDDYPRMRALFAAASATADVDRCPLLRESAAGRP